MIRAKHINGHVYLDGAEKCLCGHTLVEHDAVESHCKMQGCSCGSFFTKKQVVKPKPVTASELPVPTGYNQRRLSL